MKQIIPVADYVFDASAQTITFSSVYTGLKLANIELITNVLSGVNAVIYQFNKIGFGGSLTGLVLTLDYNTTLMNDTDDLQIFIEANFLNLSDDVVEIIQQTGKYLGKTAYCFNVMGRRAGFTSTSVINDVKEFDNGVADIPILSNSTLDIISSSANDAAAGTGVQTVKVVYINNSNNMVQSAAITLNGVTLVTSVLTGVNEVLWMETDTVGSGVVAAGNIRLRINGGTVEVEQISAGGNRSLSARFMVPTGYTAYLRQWDGHSINNDQDMRLRATVNSFDRSISSAYKFQDNKYLAVNTNSPDDLPFLKFPALCKIKVSTISAGTAGAVRCDTSFFIILIAD